MRPARPLLMTALVTLFLAQGQRALFGSLFGLVYDAIFPAFRPGPALLATLPLLLLLAPLLPLARWLDRRNAVAVSALGVALFRLPLTHPALPTRLVAGALVVACGAMFVMWTVGYLDRRALAGGVVTGLVVDQLMRLAGGSYDLSLQPGWLPAQAVLTLAVAALVVGWAREAPPEAGPGGLERRAGGLRLRGALALGALLFLALHVLGLPPVVAAWTGIGYPMAAALLGLAGATAAAAVLLLPRPTGGRAMTLVLVALAAGSAIVGYAVDGPGAALLMAAGYLGTLLLVTRTLDPASGRRGGVMVTAGFAIFFLATTLYALTFFPAFTVPGMEGAAPWIFGGVGLLLAGCFVLLPRPGVLPAPAFRGPAGVLALAVAGTAMTLAAVAAVPSGDTVEPPARGTLRVGTWNIHYGFDEAWRFDPGATADALARAGPQVVAIQEAVVGAPTSYGVDLPRWIGRRLGHRSHFAPTVNGLLGDAFLTSLEDVAVEAVPLPRNGGEAKQVLRLVARVGGDPVTFHALHLGLRDSARPGQIRTALAGVGPGPAVVLGDLNAEPDSEVIRSLEAAGFRDAFGDPAAPEPTFPARRPEIRIDWIWVRGLDTDSAIVLPDTPSDHRPVVAILHFPAFRIRSTDDNDLQTP